MSFELNGGYLTVGRFRGAPVRVHVATPIGFWFFCGFSFAPIAWTAFFLLILAHEIGHALLVKKYRLSILSVDVNPLGGACVWSGYADGTTRAKIAWGGVLAQGVILLVTSILVGVVPPSPTWSEVVGVWTGTNLVLIALNLLPIAPLDGAEAWKVFDASLFRRGKSKKRRNDLVEQAKKIERELARIRKTSSEEAADDAPHSGKRVDPSMYN